MKDVFVQKVTQIPSCLTDSAEASLSPLAKVSEGSLTPSEGYRHVRRSAAMIGLAISMSAMGMFLSHKATAATATGNPQATLADLSNNTESELNNTATEASISPNSTQAAASPLKAPTLKYEVQQGESVWKLGETFQVQPIAIAASDRIFPKSDVITGQTVRIPATNPENLPSQAQPLQAALAPSVIQNPRNLNSSPFREQPTTNAGRPNLVASENVAPVVLASPIPEKGAIADVSDVSQPLQVIPAQENQVTVATGTSDTPIPIAVPTPEMQELEPVASASVPQLKSPIPLSSPPPTLSLPRKPENNSSGQSSQAIAVSKLESMGSSSNPPQDSDDFNTPINILVPSSETASLPNISQPTEDLEHLSTSSLKAPTPLQPEFSDQPTASNSDFDNQQEDVYAIQPGDTIDNIAQQHGISRTAIIQANKINDPNLIKVNQNLVIPSPPQANTNNPVVTSQPPIANNKLTTLPTPVALEAPKISVKAIEPTQTIPISVDAPTATYTNQLKNDIARLQQSQGNESRSLMIPVQQVAQVSNPQNSLKNEDINPEWKGTTSTKTEKNRSLPRAYTAPQNSLQQLQRQYQPVIRSSGISQSQIIGSAPINVEGYNSNFHTPVGQEVSPDLPPLSTPDFLNAPTNNMTVGYIWPAKGVLTSGYGRRWGRMHRGIDIAGPVGTPIVAAAPGEVITAGWNAGGYGNLVKIRHVDGSVTLYAHNSRILVRTGEEVAQGQQISAMGNTGRSTGPHLHFEVRPNGKAAINPIAYLPNDRS